MVLAKRSVSFIIGLFLLAGCAPTAAPRTSQTATEAAQPPAARKSIVFGVRGEINSFSLAEVGSGGAGRALAELWLQGLVTSDEKSQAPTARIAAELPTVDRGTMRVNDDGSMTVTWTLRADVKWADGVPLTAEDFLFGYRVATDPGTPFPSGTLGGSCPRWWPRTTEL